ncbi:MAG: sigma-70 family RNA polymerase sigma factor [Alphaproteobacteria bacterium]|nr:sigma-70 family RNA polymerase sigma factor [Alphaproteobacteria bacterium]
MAGELLTKVRKSRALLEEFLIRREKIGRFLTARLGNSVDAEDVLQEMFMRLSHADTADEIKDPGAYLFRMAMNASRDYRRDHARARVREGMWAETQYTIQAGGAVFDAPSADAALAARQLLMQVRNALAELSPQCQRVFRMHKFEGLPHREVADALGISRRTVEKHMHTALRHLMKRMDRD